MDSVKILDAAGKPMEQKAPRASMLSGGSRTPYDAADNYGSHMSEWQPYLWSPDCLSRAGHGAKRWMGLCSRHENC
jgi:hypothetical protein